MQRKLYLFKRNGGVYYVQFTDPITGGRSTAQSTRTKDKVLANERAFDMLYKPKNEKKDSTILGSIKNILETNKLSKNELFQLQKMLGVTGIGINLNKIV